MRDPGCVQKLLTPAASIVYAAGTTFSPCATKQQKLAHLKEGAHVGEGAPPKELGPGRNALPPRADMDTGTK